MEVTNHWKYWPPNTAQWNQRDGHSALYIAKNAKEESTDEHAGHLHIEQQDARALKF